MNQLTKEEVIKLLRAKAKGFKQIYATMSGYNVSNIVGLTDEFKIIVRHPPSSHTVKVTVNYISGRGPLYMPVLFDDTVDIGEELLYNIVNAEKIREQEKIEKALHKAREIIKEL